LDRRSQFKLSPQLYGRSSEFDAIAESIGNINSQTAEILLLTGDSGIGKTALVNQVIPSIIGSKGYFIAGKFEQLGGSTPYKAIIQALRELIQQLLTETLESRQLWQQKIQTAIANNGKVITNILPELELIIGSQADIPKLPTRENQNRFNNVFIKFLQVFAQAESPLILFLDNLQWADSGSLNLLELLLEDHDSRHLLIVGAYCDRVVEESPLVHTIAKISQATQVKQINLQPLAIAEINCLLVDTLNCEPERSLPLAQLLLQRTHGNLFLLNLLLQAFEREQLITFDFATLSWQWSIPQIQSTSLANYNILELLCSNLNQLPPACLQILKLAACIGDRFDLKLLTNIWQEIAKLSAIDTVNLNQELDYALQEGIIILSIPNQLPLINFARPCLSNNLFPATTSRIKPNPWNNWEILVARSSL
ncbi:MAG: AAA family ATPase, partial [Hydrococcus sp. SU_1_0]|nr:AAA family ATPase [Hydrococcus sp. SU_1_0]